MRNTWEKYIFVEIENSTNYHWRHMGVGAF